MRHLPVLAASTTLFALFAAGPVLAEGVTLRLENRSSDTVSGINSFPIGDDGEVVDDNVGGLYDDVQPGGSASFTLTGVIDCAPIRFYVRLASRAAAGRDDLTLDVDTCTDRTIVVSD